jgi:3-methylfumaryl-CoA hydratase
MTLDTQHLRTWIGRQETLHDQISAAPLRLMRATLDLPAQSLDAPNADLPALWHWLYFLPSPQASAIGADGHAKRGGFLPPVPLPRRMWAGGQLAFFEPLRVGDAVSRTSTIEEVVVKSGRSGELCFVKVLHEVSGPRGLALREWHDIVYRPEPAPDAASPAYAPAPQATWSEALLPDDVLLFRYSALTFNGHRIHYDRRYVTEVEKYPGLVVHGPLMATLLAGLGSKQFAGRRATAFSFRALKPVFDGHGLHVCGAPSANGNTADLWIKDHAGHCAMRASMEFAA